MNQEDKVPKKPGSVFPSPLLRVDMKGKGPVLGSYWEWGGKQK